MRLVGELIINVLALFVVAYIVPGFELSGLQVTIVTAIVIGVVNTFIRPVLQIIALPFSILTLGITAFLINVALLWLVAAVVPGFEIANFVTAAIASIVLALVSAFLHKLAKEKAND